MTHSRLTMAALLLWTTAAAADTPLVRTIVKGTQIDFAPSYVDVVSSNPRRAAADLYALGGVIPQKQGDIRHEIVVMNGISYSFFTPCEYNAQQIGYEFKDGDVVYKFWLGSKAEEDRFADRYGLTLAHADTKLGGRVMPLHAAEPGYYVFFGIPTLAETTTAIPWRPVTAPEPSFTAAE